MTTGFTVCVVGRPNVGKSTLFNKLTRTRRAIVDDMPGVTRDRMFGRAELDGVSTYLIDTGGFEPDGEDIIVSQIREQAMLAIEEADRICFVVDGREGLTAVDIDIADLLRRSGKEIVLAANKLDTPQSANEMADFHSLGFEKVIAVSAEHSIGFGELSEALVKGEFKDLLEEAQDDGTKSAAVPVAVVGCPNAGKSSLVNRLLGEKRMTVSEIPGTTRDSIDSLVRWNKKEYLFTDTAGIRKKNKISQRIEKYSVIMAIKSIVRSKVALLIIDATKDIRDQDARIAGMIRDEGKACIILVNKWDIVEKDSMSTERFTDELRDKLKFISFAPVVFISAKTGQRTGMIFETLERVMAEYGKRVDTGPLNRLIKKLTDRRPPPAKKGKRAKIFYVSQTKTEPPIFNFVASRPEAVSDQYKRYLTNRIRDEYGFEGAPVICRFEPRKDNR